MILFYPSPFLGGGQIFFEKMTIEQTTAKTVWFCLIIVNLRAAYSYKIKSL